MRQHRFFGIDRTGRPEPAANEMASGRLQDEAVTADDDFVVKNHRDLRPRWARPIENRRDGQGHHDDRN